VVLVIPMPGKKKVPECHSGLRPSEKELPQRRSGIFCHKNIPGHIYTHFSKILGHFVRFQVLTAASMKIRAFWDVAPCSLIGVDRRFRGLYCLHHQAMNKLCAKG
jgi:hypothetical protein